MVVVDGVEAGVVMSSAIVLCRLCRGAGQQRGLYPLLRIFPVNPSATRTASTAASFEKVVHLVLRLRRT